MTYLYSATADIIAPGGYLRIDLGYRTGYAQTGLVAEHNLLYFDADNRLFYRQSDAKLVWSVDGEELASSALTFSASQDLTITVEHAEGSRELTVSGATTGDGTATSEPDDGETYDPILLPSVAYVIGSDGGGSLLSLTPDLTTFAELADERCLVQMDDATGNRRFRDFMQVLADGAGKFRDVCIAMRSAFDPAHASGEQLDMIGAVVGLPREAATDARYRVLLGIQIDLLVAGNSESGHWAGTCESVLAIARRFLDSAAGTIYLRNQNPYDYLLTLTPVMTLDEVQRLTRFLRIARYAGVRGVIVGGYSTGDVWGSDAVAVTGAGLWGSDSVAVTDASSWGMVDSTD